MKTLVGVTLAIAALFFVEVLPVLAEPAAYPESAEQVAASRGGGSSMGSTRGGAVTRGGGSSYGSTRSGGSYPGGAVRGGGGTYYGRGGSYTRGGYPGGYYPGGYYTRSGYYRPPSYYRYGGYYGSGVDVWIGPGWGWWWGYPYPYYPYPYSYSYPSYPYYGAPAPVPRQEFEFVEPEQHWYYCRDPEGYYPYVKECPKGWLKVVPDQEPREGDRQPPQKAPQ